MKRKSYRKVFQNYLIEHDFLAESGKLLSWNSNSKIIKESKNGSQYLTANVSLYPNDNVCLKAVRNLCKSICLTYAGRGKFSSVQKARLQKLKFFENDRELFITILVEEILKFRNFCEKRNLKPAIRLNCFSDIDYSKISLIWENQYYESIFQLFPEIQFYDYTKDIDKVKNNTYENYHLTYSFDGNTSNFLDCQKVKKAFQLGINVAVCFSPDKYQLWKDHSYLAIDGEISDNRFLDPKDKHGFIVCLKAKGKALKQIGKNPFIVNY
tara:strand:+ start:19 stop:822 length:804 start_codon:yes stop_codon:yes gene_type:complete